MKGFLEHLREKEKEERGAEENAAKLLEAANGAARTVSARHLSFIALCVYVSIVVASTTDEMLLRISPVKLPLVGVNIPIVGFYAVAPWFLVLFHFDLLLQFQMLASKLAAFKTDLEGRGFPSEAAARLRERLTNFHYAHLIARAGESGVLRRLFYLILWVTLLCLPLVVLLWGQARFLAYHGPAVTWIQRAAVTLDVVLLAWFWGPIMSPSDSSVPAGPGWRALVSGLHLVSGGRGLLYLVALIFAWGIATIPESDKPWKSRPWTWLPAAWLGDKKPLPNTLAWWIVLRNLDLRGATLTDNKNLRVEVIKALRSGNPEERQKALKQVLGLDLKGRDLRYANLTGAILPEVELGMTNDERPTQLQGANLDGAQLQGANLYGARLQGAGFEGAQLQGAHLVRAQLQGADLLRAQLQGADLLRAHLQGANLDGAQLQHTDLTGAAIRGVNVNTARMDFAILRNLDLKPLTPEIIQAIEQSLPAKMDEDSKGKIRARLFRAIEHPGPIEGIEPLPVLCDTTSIVPLLLCAEWGKQNKGDYLITREGYLASLACGDKSVAEGLIRSEKNASDFYRALIQMDTAGHCEGVSALSEELKAALRKIAQHPGR